jgi:hypothetical protein
MVSIHIPDTRPPGANTKALPAQLFRLLDVRPCNHVVRETAGIEEAENL